MRCVSAVDASARLPDRSDVTGSAWTPFRHRAFTVLWIATVVSNVGVWMQNAAAGWLMTTLDPDPFVVSMVQFAATFPMFLFALPAGAIADIVDRRRLLVLTQMAAVVLAGTFGFIVFFGHVSAGGLIVFSLLAATAAALVMPAWQAVVPQLVPRPLLQSAVALNSVGLNVSRALGPALAGIVIAAWGMAAPFWVNSLTTAGVVAALIWWRPSKEGKTTRLPPEPLFRAISSGLRHARHNVHLRATLIRAFAFFIFASAYWAVLPLIARNQVAGGPALYGFLLAAIGLGAVSAAFTLPALKQRLGADRLAAAGTLGTALALILFAAARDPITALAASLIAGIAWITALATINVSAQMALPPWVRGRGLSIYVAVMFGAMSLGSAIWGKAATFTGVPIACMIAAAGAALSVPILMHWKLQTAATLDLTPSMHWPEPIVSSEIDSDRGPVMVTVEYRINPADRTAFLAALAKLADERRRDGAFDWSVFEDVAQESRFVETFLLDSWLQHLRQHERVSNTDRELQDIVHGFHLDGTPRVTHLITAQPH
jgi:MFS family permease